MTTTPFTIKLLVALSCFTVLCLASVATDTCSTSASCCTTGISGRDGKDGHPGRDGIPGRDGTPGRDGRDGDPGHDGRDGEPGRDGNDGAAGRPGSDGSDGAPGRPGSDGLDGIAGPPGRNGRDGLPGLPGRLTTADREQLKEEILDSLREQLSMQRCNSTSTPPKDQSAHPHAECKNIKASKASPAASCKAIYKCDPTAPSGNYWINTTTGPVQAYCEMNAINCSNTTGGWMRVAHIDMTNTSRTCPRGLTLTTVSSTRMCRGGRRGRGCNPLTFPTHSLPYTKVCGRARGYQLGTPDAFYNTMAYRQTSLDGYYADGLSVTSGSPRKHIWTFAAGITKDSSFDRGMKNCPCSAPHPGIAAPSFVGENYFCESGDTGSWSYGQWYLDDPLWDSHGCLSGSTCCDRGGPWFTNTLSQEVSDDIEVRWCFGEGGGTNEGVGVDQLEILVY